MSGSRGELQGGCGFAGVADGAVRGLSGGGFGPYNIRTGDGGWATTTLGRFVMRSSFTFLLALVLLLAMAVPGAAEPANSGAFVHSPIDFTLDLPNPCTGDVVEYWIFGDMYTMEKDTPDGSHFLERWWAAGETTDGFRAERKMIGPDVINEHGDVTVYTGIGNYQFRNDAGDKFRLKVLIHTTEMDGELKSDVFVFDFKCLGNS
jgi:hypothetical protein